MHCALLDGGREVLPLRADIQGAATGLSGSGSAHRGGGFTGASGSSDDSGVLNQSAVLADMNFGVLAVFFEFYLPEDTTGAGFAIDIGDFRSAGLFAIASEICARRSTS